MDKLCFFFLVIVSSVNKLQYSFAKTIYNSTTDAKALVALKVQITSDPYNILANSWSTNTSICNWTGISCGRKQARVTALNFSGCGFKGTIAPQVGNLTFLSSLDVSFNNFTGTLPLELSHLRRLKVVNAGFNSFSGKVPSWLGTLPELQRIVLRNNSFSGSIPKSLLGNYSRLQVLDISFNSLDGNIPQEVGNLTGLEELLLYGNQLNGPIPFGIFNLSSLKVLDLGYNNLSGRLPEDICHDDIAPLAALNLPYNQLSGQIPPNLVKCRYLQEVLLSYNHFNGRIPSSIGDLTTLSVLNLETNDFSGWIPLEIGNLSRLEILMIQSNSLSGPIPACIFNMSSLKFLDFSNNSLSGHLPRDILEHKTLEEINLRRNKLTGGIPAQIGNLTGLKYLALGENNLTGQLPVELGNLNLVTLKISQNQLSGSIPSSIFNISTLTSMAFTLNHFSGDLPSSLGLLLPNLKVLGLASNSFSGVIPSSITNASKLTTVEMGVNYFTGAIPNFGALRLLNCLHLSKNKLSGETWRFISSLTNCRYLKDFDISHNQVSGVLPPSIGNFSTSLTRILAYQCNIQGAIPAEIGNLSSLQWLELGGNQLTGFIPGRMGEMERLERLHLYQNKLEGYIPVELCQSRKLGSLILSDNELCGSIPSCLGEVKSLRNVYLDSNKFSTIPLDFWNLGLEILNLSNNSLNGSLPSELGNLKVINYVDLSWNQFSGDIPSSIGKMKMLAFLSFAHNKLDGSIPQSLGSITSLESLDLSYNNFSGSIPQSLEKLNFLRHFDVSHNRIEGEIPSGGNFGSFTTQSFIPNNGLCSETRPDFPHCVKNHKRPRSKNFVLLMIFLPTTFVIIVGTITLVSFARRQKANRNKARQNEVAVGFSWRIISYLELKKATNEFSEGNILGIGSFGSVYSGILSEGLNVAVKVFNLHLQAARATKSFVTECKVLSTIHHRNLIKIIGCCSNTDFKALVLEYMSNGSLEKWLYCPGHFLDMLQRLNIAIDVAVALDYLHHGDILPIVHCDLKPSNVLLDEDMVAHVGDFGIAKLIGEGESMAQTKTLATIGYMAPEYGTEGIVSTSGDVYSYGVMLLEMYTRKKPTNDMFNEEMNLKTWVTHSLHKNAICEVMDSYLLPSEDQNLPKIEQCMFSIFALAMECLIDSPTERIGVRKVVAELQKIRSTFLARQDSSVPLAGMDNS